MSKATRATRTTRHASREILAIPPRYWLGWEIEDHLLVWYLFRDLLPAPVQDYMKGYWPLVAAA